MSVLFGRSTGPLPMVGGAALRDAFHRFFHQAAALRRRSYEQVEPNLVPIGVVGAVAFPMYYVIWGYLFPQPYESALLRLIGTAFCVVLALKHRWPGWLRKRQLGFFHILLLYTLPFFFTYMLLRNGVSAVWLLSTLTALFLLVLLVDWFSLLCIFLLGTLLAWLAYFATVTGPMVDVLIYFEYFPVFMFALVGGMIFNYKMGYIQQERLLAVREAASTLSSELMAPLQSVRTGAVSLTKFVPSLIHSHQVAAERNLPVSPIEPAHLTALGEMPERITTEVEHALTVVDMVMMNAEGSSALIRDRRPCRMSHCIDQAVRRYPFKSDREKARVVVRAEGDFLFLGNEKLMVHLLLNLMKKALRAVAEKGIGNVCLIARTGDAYNHLVVRDTGSGTPDYLLARMFDRQADLDADRGLLSSGLSLCKAVVESWGGAIDARSEVGSYTEIVITFPSAAEAAPVP